MSAQRFEALDGLRGIAAVFVVLHHALSPFGLQGRWVPHAQLAVDFFFALSGFVLTAAYATRLRQGGSARALWRLRVLRLWPLAACGLLLGLLMQVPQWARGRGLPWPELLSSLAANALLLPAPMPLWAGRGMTWPFNGALWSLWVEMLLSLAFVAGAWRLRGRWLGAALLLAGLALVGLAATQGSLMGGHDARSTWVGPLRGAYPFLAGMLLAQRHCASGARTPPVSAWWSVGALALVLLWPTPGFTLIYELMAMLVLLPAVVWLGARARGDHGPLARGMAVLGHLSFPLYALHVPLIHLGSGLARRWQLDQGLGLLGVVAVELVASLLLARWAGERVEPWLRARLARRWSLDGGAQRVGSRVRVG